jgi:hypothetical protein
MQSEFGRVSKVITERECLSVFMKENVMRNVLVVLAVLAIATAAQAGRVDTSCSSGNGTFTFSNASWIGGIGWSSGAARNISKSCSCSNCQHCNIYGWARSPLVEYYVCRSGGTNRGSSCGGNLYTNNCNGPNITGDGSFMQYNASGCSGDMGCHFNGWSNLGYGVSNHDYQIVAAENYSGGSGTATISVSGASWVTYWWGSGSVSFSCGGGGSTTTTSGSTTTTSGGSTTTSGGGGTSITVRGRSTDGNGRIDVNVGGNTITSWTLGTGMADWNTSTQYSGGLNVCFTNDTTDRDIQIDYVRVGGETRQSENQSYNTGVWQNDSCGGSYSEWLHCNGCIGYGDVSGGGSTTTTSGGSTTTTSSWWWGGGGWWW